MDRPKGSPALLLVLLSLTFFPLVQQSIALESKDKIDSFLKDVTIIGATPVGSKACASCHSEINTTFQHAFHAQQGLECEDCHGNGSLHVEAGGDVTKILSFSKLPIPAANAVCLSCHARDSEIRHWQGGSHSANRLECIDCHQIHNYGALTATRRSNFDTSTRGAGAVRMLSPETNVMLRPRSETNDSCLKCHPTEAAQTGLPYHHPLREGKMSCVDCHDPHGGPAGNNLRTANLNQLCLSCHSQYRGPFAYQHPPVTENCMNCHTAHGSPNTNLLSVSEPALCLQCHAGHHNGAGLPLPDRCTNCHGSIHGTDVATPSGGSRFVDKGPHGLPSNPPQSGSVPLVPLASHDTYHAPGASSSTMGALATGTAPLSNSGMTSTNGGLAGGEYPDAGFSFTPGTYRFVDGSGFLGRVGEYDTLDQSPGVDAVASYVSQQKGLTLASRANILSGQDYSAALQIAAGKWLQAGFDLGSFVQQQDNYPFYGGVMSSDLQPFTDLIPAHTPFGIQRNLGDAYARMKLGALPIHFFVNGSWQARTGQSQLAYLDENTTTSCGEVCHFTSRLQSVNYTTRTIGGGADIDLGKGRFTWEHYFSSFSDRISFPVASFGPFTPGDEPPPPPVPVPPDVPAGNYYLDIPSPNQSTTDSLNFNWASSKWSLTAHAGYARLSNTFTENPQNQFDSDETLNWRPADRLRLTVEYHQHNLINNFTPFYNLYGNVSYHNHWEGVRFEYELSKSFDIEARYRHGGITRSNSSLWPQAYSFDNTDKLTVVPSSSSNTVGWALRYRDRDRWSVRGGYDWTGSNNPGYLIVPGSSNRIFVDVSVTPTKWLTFTNDLNVIAQNDFTAIQRRNRFYEETARAMFQAGSGWNLGLGYSYQQNNLTTDMAFQNDTEVGYVLDQHGVPYKQIGQSYWGESTYTVKQRLGLNLRLTYVSARSAFEPNVNPNNPALFGNGPLISQGTFDPVLFQQALGNLQLGATQVSQVIVPQWLGQFKADYLFPYKIEGGFIVTYGSYKDYWNPNLNGTLRTFNIYAGHSW